MIAYVNEPNIAGKCWIASTHAVYIAPRKAPKEDPGVGLFRRIPYELVKDLSERRHGDKVETTLFVQSHARGSTVTATFKAGAGDDVRRQILKHVSGRAQ